MDVGAVKAPTIRRSQVMQTIATIGLDIAKSVFQVHGVDNDGKVVIRRQLKRHYVLAFFEKLQPCLVGSRPVPRLTIGHASCRHLAIPCG
jgi:transposase